jgi:putative cell wall-binding protein
VGPATEPSALTIADVDGDGYRDLATTTDISEVALLANDSETAFTRVADCPTVGVTSRAVTMVDVDGDAHPDVLATNTNDDSLSVGRITGRLVGTVTNAVSGQAVADTAITVIDEQGETVATANTGSDGSYALANLPAHDYTVTADHPEYQSASGEATVRGTETTAVDLALEPTATGAITGEVTDAATGQTIGGVELTVTSSDGSQVASATTAGDGIYRVADLDTSVYTVTANDADYQSASKQTTVTHGDIATLDFALTPATKDDESDGDNIDGTDGGGDNGHSGGDGSGGRSDRSGDGVSNDSDSSAGGDGGAGDDGADGGADRGGADNGGAGGAHEGGSGDGGFGGDGEGGSKGDGGGADGGGAARRGDSGGDSERAPLGVQAGVARVAGRDRFATAARLSEQAYPEGAEVAYVATGLGFADALTGGVAAGRAPGPVLLVSGAGVPAVTAGELQRLDPDRLVIVGGRGAVDASMASALAGYADRVERLAGANRFATARAVAQAAFPRPGAVDTVYVASGQTFADALAGGPAAVQAGAPLLLAGRDELPPATRAALQRFGPRRVVLLGGPTALSETVAQAAAGFADTVQRLAGPTRFATAAAIARQRFGGGVDEVMVATGTGFADALAGGAVAGARGVPLLLAAPEGLTAPTRSAVARLAPATGRLLGGPAALSDRVHGQVRQALPGDGGGG